jgi:pimeloyl-ACP methyl ester carboxylesterase
MGMELTPFKIDVPDKVLDDLRERLRRTRWPDQIPGAEWDYGAELTAVQHLCEYWLDGYDWRAAEAALNTWPQFTTTVDPDGGGDIHLHFVHARSPEPDALPLIITHGWPGSIVEFQRVVGPLTDPVAHGGNAADAFHVVAPSLPGYAFSGPTTRRGVDIRVAAQANAALMAGLGYDRYVAQGGDWGAMATQHIALVDPDHVAAIHLNMVVAGPPDPANPTDGVTPEEMAGLASMGEFVANETGYQQIQGTKPQTLAYGLTDSPAGLAAWIYEKFRTWSDCDGDPLNIFTIDELLTNITVYWVTGTINSSTRMYYESMKSKRFGAAERVQQPVGVANFPKELYQPPRAWAETRYNIQRWERFDQGGHFAAMEQPDVLVREIREFFRSVR